VSINCPKCGFYQPKDQYCASCGIDMKKHKAPQASLWKRLVGNWLFQLGALLIVVVVFTYWDGRSPKENSTDQDQSYLLSKPHKSELAKLKNKSESPELVPPPPVSEDQRKSPVPPPPSSPPSELTAVASSAENLQAEVPQKKTTFTELSKSISIFYYFVEKSILENLISQGESVGTGITKLKSSLFAKEIKTNRAAWNKIKSKSSRFELDKVSRISAASDAEDFDSRPIGFFIDSEVRVNTQTASLIDVSLSLSRRLQFGAETSPTNSSSNFSLQRSPREIVLVTGFAGGTPELSESENQFFENDEFLKYVVEPQFSDEFSDLVLVLQYK